MSKLKLYYLIFEWTCNIVGFLFLVHLIVQCVNHHETGLENSPAFKELIEIIGEAL